LSARLTVVWDNLSSAASSFKFITIAVPTFPTGPPVRAAFLDLFAAGRRGCRLAVLSDFDGRKFLVFCLFAS
jgi:hypothetical protein